jgi:hypothetical protein
MRLHCHNLSRRCAKLSRSSRRTNRPQHTLPAARSLDRVGHRQTTHTACATASGHACAAGIECEAAEEAAAADAELEAEAARLASASQDIEIPVE